jgi:hypothetical protein
VTPQDIIPRQAQNGIVQLRRGKYTAGSEMVRLGHFSRGRSILEPVATEFAAPVNTQSHVAISQEPNRVIAPSMHNHLELV